MSVQIMFFVYDANHNICCILCQQILIEMHDSYLAGDEHVQPDTQSFKSVMLAWAKAVDSEQDAPRRAQRVLEWMINLYQTNENSKAKPDVECFEIVLRAWSKSGDVDAPEKTEHLIVWMEKLYNEGVADVKPRTRSFNAVLVAWSKSPEKYAAQRAEDILYHMQRLYDSGNEDLKPDAISYGTVVSTWTKSGKQNGPRRAEKILRLMEIECDYGDSTLRPDVILYNFVIEAFSKSDEKFAYKDALSVLRRQITMYRSGVNKCRPDIYSFTSVIAACASFSGHGKERTSAFKAAVATFDELLKSEYVSPNHVTYGTMMKATARLLPLRSQLRRKWTKKLFEKSSKDGYVGDMFLSWLKEAASPKHYHELTRGRRRQNLPPEWTRNVIERRPVKK
uniref:Pentacotripeptide-repeat region of PRORP domain-containing protein n=1 Tax=Ditylum brightwellii TaxID=49249 RepID=A0A7S4QLX9_9STRA